MRSSELRSVFRRVLALSLLPPAALAACGGGIADVPGDADSGSCDGVKTFCSTTAPERPRADGGVVYYVGDGDSSVLKADASFVDVHVGVDASVPEDAHPDTGCVVTPPPPPPEDAAFSCSWTVPLPCAVSLQTGPTQTECQQYCGQPAFFCNAMTNPDPDAGGGAWVLQCVSCAIGRRPEGFTARAGAANSNAHACAGSSPSVVGRFFAIAAELEAASVFSFERLERELEAHGAPSELRRRARSAAEDERRHARVTKTLAARFGGTTHDPANGSMALRDLEAVALENAVEGCVRETFGALTATLQAERATDPRVRAAMRRIASDETAHAALAWSIASWLSTRLGPDAEAQLHAAMAHAIDGLAHEVTTDPPLELQSVCGLPNAREAATMVEGMRELLWAA